MRRIIINSFGIMLALAFSVSCKKSQDEPVQFNSRQNNFEVFWKDFDQNYAAFILDNVNWDSLNQVYQPLINSSTSNAALFNILKTCISLLKDAHSDLDGGQYGTYSYYDLFVQQKPSNFISWDVISSKYVQVIRTDGKNLAYGKINDSVGYFYIGSFDDNENDYLLIDSFLVRFKDAKGVIIDVRQNGGGNEAYGQIIASRFTNQSVIYRYARSRNGPNHSDLTDFDALQLDPDGITMFAKKVILLTNRSTFSAAEDFTLMMKSLPNVIHIGDTTFGGAATHPVERTLPNGWNYRLATTINYDLNKKTILTGIAPDSAVLITASDILLGKDRILEEAIKKIN